MKRVWLGGVSLCICGLFACNFLLPDRFVVNAPLRSMLFGHQSDPPSASEIARSFQLPAGFGISLFAA